MSIDEIAPKFGNDSETIIELMTLRLQMKERMNVIRNREPINEPVFDSNIQNDGIAGGAFQIILFIENICIRFISAGIFGSIDGYSHSVAMTSALSNTFKVQDFKSIQLPIVNASLLRHDCFVLMPTGGGSRILG